MYQKFRLSALLLSLLLCISSMAAYAQNGDDDESPSFPDIPSWVIQSAYNFIQNYDDILYNFHLDNVDYTPVPEGERLTLRTNFLTSLIPFTWANLNLNVKVFSERRYNNWMPQVDISASYGRIIGLDVAAAFLMEDSTSSIKAPKMNEYNLGIILTKSVSRETRLFAGFQYSVFNMKIDIPESLSMGESYDFIDTIVLEPLRRDGLTIGKRDYILVVGITNLVKKKKHKVAYVGYGFKYKKIFSRIATSYEHFEWGCNIYPEGFLVVHPFLGWHWSF